MDGQEVEEKKLNIQIKNQTPTKSYSTFTVIESLWLHQKRNENGNNTNLMIRNKKDP